MNNLLIKQEAPVLYEASVNFAMPHIWEKAPKSMRPFHYIRHYIPKNFVSEDTVYCYSEFDFLKLLVHWNNDVWQYKPKV